MRRSASIGVVLGAAAGLALGVVEVAYLALTAWACFDGPLELGRFAASLAGLCIGAGAVAGVALSLAGALLGRLAARLGGGAWTARLLALVAAGPIALAAAQVFRGPQARLIPGHTVFAVALFAAGVATVYGATLAYRTLLDAPARRFAAVGLGAGTLACYVADQRVLPRLYPFFHHGLAALAAASAAAALGLALRAHLRQFVAYRAALGLLAVGLLAGALSLGHLSAARALRTLTLERTALARLVLAGAPALGARSTRPSAAAARRAAAAPLGLVGPRLGDVDVFLISVDALRADRLVPRVAPEMSRLFDAGVRFERAYAQVPHTSFSVATLLTGKYVYALSALGLDAERHATLAELLRRERYKTAAFYPPSVFYVEHERLRGLESSAYGFEYVKYEYLGAPARTDQVIRFLEEERPARAFVWVHYLEPHEPYELHPGHPPVGAAPSAEERYEGEIHFVDAEVARLIAYLRVHRPRALVVLAADHGEEFGEHGGHYHGTTLYEEQVRVPLAFVALDGSLRPARVDGPVGLVDVAPTVLSLLGVPVSARVRGRDLSPWLVAGRGPVTGPVFAELERKKMVVDGGKKLICDLSTEACELYDLATDAGERRNRIDDAELAGPLRAELDGWLAAETEFERGVAGPLDEAARRVLERARLGDRGAARGLVELAAQPGPARREAVRRLVELPADPQAADVFARAAADADAELARWGAVGQARLGDPAARARVTAELGGYCQGGEPELCARAALVVGDAGSLGRALEQVGADRELELQLVRALGQTHDPRALDPLVVQLAEVRTRVEVVDAIEALGDARAVPRLARWMAADPYIPVRAAMARALGTLGRGDPEAAAALAALAAVEREAPVRAAVAAAQAALGVSPPTAPPSRDTAHDRRGRAAR
jgi:arylsulfatase A-like enzyme